ncbi:hypothetical protein F4820DRAFT_381338 [Hypoxylon rubiginosum]|uniref:Uncharacterized protein n=1 Tax=Hypoxylon rubiginosum TaxID=110542 RepID=A0ACB9YVU2_9PEZI|nr:hypothetical protein F4820DRAFT_381338 [Hypoxylon rubiginosum]
MAEAANNSPADAEPSTSQQVPAHLHISWTGYGSGVGGVHDHLDDLIVALDHKFDQMRQDNRQLRRQLDLMMNMMKEHFQTTTNGSKSKTTSTPAVTVPMVPTQTGPNSGTEDGQTPLQAEPTPTPLPQANSRTRCGKCQEEFPSRNKLMKHVYSDTCHQLSPSEPSTISSTPRHQQQHQEIEVLRAEVVTLNAELRKLRRGFEENKGEVHNKIEKVRYL